MIEISVTYNICSDFRATNSNLSCKAIFYVPTCNNAYPDGRNIDYIIYTNNIIICMVCNWSSMQRTTYSLNIYRQSNS